MLAVGIPSSAEPRPNPFTMGPLRRIGKGGGGPVGGPASGERDVGGWGCGLWGGIGVEWVEVILASGRGRRRAIGRVSS